MVWTLFINFSYGETPNFPFSEGMLTYFPFPFSLSSVNFPSNPQGEMGITLNSLRITWIFISQWSVAMKLIIALKEGHYNLELAIELTFLSKEPKPFKPGQVLQQSKKLSLSQQWDAGDRNGQDPARSQWASYRLRNMGDNQHHGYPKTGLILILRPNGGLVGASYFSFATTPLSNFFLFFSLFM